MPQNTSLRDAYRFPGLLPLQRVREEAQAFVVTLVRRRKKVAVAVVVRLYGVFTTLNCVRREIWIAAIIMSLWSSLTVEFSALGVA